MNEPSPRSQPQSIAASHSLIERVQRELQREILGKLLHDLRNPIHSIQISMELFGRVARNPSDPNLCQRAAAYVDPAEAAVTSLRIANARLTRYLTVPGEPKLAPLQLGELMSEVTLLLRASRRQLRVSYQPDESGASAVIEADATRLAHLLIHHCLGNAASSVRLSADDGSSGGVAISGRFEDGASMSAEAAPRPTALTASELEQLVEAAGGKVARHDEAGFSFEFRRASHH